MAETGSWKVWVALGIAVVIAVVTYQLAVINKAFKISVGKDGNVAIEVNASDSFAEIFNRAVGSDQETVDTILAGKEYYKVTNPKLVNSLENLDYSRPDSQEIAKKLHMMLWDLRGPFTLPGTLRGANVRMADALEELKETRQEAQASALLAEMWRRFVDQEGIFALPTLRATVGVVRGTPTGREDLKVVFACPGGPLVEGLIMNLYVLGRGNIFAKVTQDARLFDCVGSALTARELLAKEIKVPLGLSETAFKQLVDPADRSGIGDARIDANFIVYPRNLAGSLILGNEGM